MGMCQMVRAFVDDVDRMTMPSGYMSTRKRGGHNKCLPRDDEVISNRRQVFFRRKNNETVRDGRTKTMTTSSSGERKQREITRSKERKIPTEIERKG